MITIQESEISDEFICPYLKEFNACNEYFFAMDLDNKELDEFLNLGWRKFGWYFFRPACRNCNKCVPLRVLAQEFKASRSQRKVLNKNCHTQFKVSELAFRDEIFDLYEKHSQVRFQQTVTQQEFIETHYFPSCPTVQTEYHVDGKLVAVGFLDHSTTSLSSIYFIYDTDYSHLSLGVFGALMEIELTRRMGLDYYHLGYWIKENASMRYKNRFYPHELFDWEKEQWSRVEK